MEFEGLVAALGREVTPEIIPGLLDNGLVILAAPEGCGKTFLAIHMAAHICSGMDWQGETVEQGMVVYCIAEGVSFFPYRVATAMDRIGVLTKKQPFYIYSGSGDLVTREGKKSKFVLDLVESIAALEGTTGQRTKLVVFDTLNCFMPGGDENNQQETGGMIDGCRYIREQLRDDKGVAPTIMLLHHYNKEGGVRGSTVLTAAADQVLVGRPIGDMVGQPMLWTTKGRNGKRKDRSPIEQWFEFKKVYMSMGDGYDPSDEEDPLDERYVPRWVKEWREVDDPECDPDDRDYYTEDIRVGAESTLIVTPVKPPTPESKAAAPKAVAALEYIKKHGPCGISAIMAGAAMAQKTAYKAVDSLVEVGQITYNDTTKKYSVAGSPFEA